MSIGFANQFLEAGNLHGQKRFYTIVPIYIVYAVYIRSPGTQFNKKQSIYYRYNLLHCPLSGFL